MKEEKPQKPTLEQKKIVYKKIVEYLNKIEKEEQDTESEMLKKI